jgi:hypothetical protein
MAKWPDFHRHLQTTSFQMRTQAEGVALKDGTV